MRGKSKGPHRTEHLGNLVKFTPRNFNRFSLIWAEILNTKVAACGRDGLHANPVVNIFVGIRSTEWACWLEHVTRPLADSFETIL